MDATRVDWGDSKGNISKVIQVASNEAQGNASLGSVTML